MHTVPSPEDNTAAINCIITRLAQQAVEGPDTNRRDSTLITLKNYVQDNRPRAELLLSEAKTGQQSENWRVRTNALQLIGATGEAVPSAIPLLEPLCKVSLEDQNLKVRTQAVKTSLKLCTLCQTPELVALEKQAHVVQMRIDRELAQRPDYEQIAAQPIQHPQPS